MSFGDRTPSCVYLDLQGTHLQPYPDVVWVAVKELKLTQLGTPIAMIPLFCLCAAFAADLLTAVAGNSQLIYAKEIVQLLYNQRIERVHDACERQGPGGRGLWKESRGGVWCAGGNVALSEPFVVSKMNLVNT